MPCLAMLLVTTTERHSRRTTTILLFSTREEYAPPAVSVFIKRTLLQIVPAIDTGMPLPDDDDFFGLCRFFAPVMSVRFSAMALPIHHLVWLRKRKGKGKQFTGGSGLFLESGLVSVLVWLLKGG